MKQKAILCLFTIAVLLGTGLAVCQSTSVEKENEYKVEEKSVASSWNALTAGSFIFN